MREVKFRVWDKFQKKMWLWENLQTFSGDSHLKLYFEDHDVEALQYTGFKTKSGAYIYEGDLLQAPPNGFEPREITEVRWSEEDGCWEVYDHDLLAHHYKNLEVIGNKWENPELLK
jgi:hypothetical protein